MKTKIKKWGNSLGLRIPKSFAQETNSDDGSPVDIKVEKEAIIIKSLKSSFKLNDLLAKITPENIHNEIVIGKNVGKETW